MAKKFTKLKSEIQQRFWGWLALSPLPESASERDKEIHYQKTMQRFARKVFWGTLLLLPLCALMLWAGIAIGRPASAPDEEKSSTHKKKAADMSKEYWSCSMHPNIRLPEKGKCPICFMNLILVKAGSDVFSLSEEGKKLAKVKSVPALYRRVSTSVRMVGKVDYDETRVVNITLWTPGRSRVHKMFVNFTGALVKKGEPLVEVYSSDLIAAQGEYISAYQAWRARGEGRESSALKSNVKASRRRLLDLGMNKKQLRALERSGQPEEMTTLYSPVSGTVIAKLTNEGEWHNRGMSLYRIADLSKVWVRMDAYESDLGYIRYAQQVEFDTETYPGKSFYGRIAFIDPFLNEMTRTVKVRVNADNPNGSLKPGMFVHARVNAQIGEDGRVWEPTLVGKWVCPVHPSIIRDRPGECGEIIDLDKQIRCPRWLVPASPSSESMQRSRVLTIPYSAPLLTGKRAIVYIEEKKTLRDDWGNVTSVEYHYQGKEVLLGPRAGDYYIVLSGLEEGQMVVAYGAYKIDSALQIKAKPSMMSPAGPQEPGKKGKEKSRKIPPFAIAGADYHRQLSPALKAYFKLVEDLATDRTERSEKHVDKMIRVLSNVSFNSPELSAPVQKQLKKDTREFLETAKELLGKDKEAMRLKLILLSQKLTNYLEDFGHDFDNPVYKIYCPMADNSKGANWWQRRPETKNPYFGPGAMQKCGEVRGKLLPLKKGDRGHLTGTKAIAADLGKTYRALFPKFVDYYLQMGDSLAKDSIKDSGDLRKKMLSILDEIYAKTASRKGEHQREFNRQLLLVKQMLMEMHGKDIKQIRRDYYDISAGLIVLVKTFGLNYPQTLYLIHCPMYRHKLGGSWLQKQREQVRNPYYGSKMLNCGDLVETVLPAGDK